MSEVLGQDTATLEKALHRLEALTAALDQVTDRRAREAARELLELMLDLHGLALARMVSAVAAAGDGQALLQALAADPQISAILLLHGLHPLDAATRLAEAIAARQSHWAERGFDVDLLAVIGGAAHLRLCKSSGSEAVEELRREVEEVMAAAAPDLDDIALDIEVAGQASIPGAAGTSALAALHAD